MFFQMKKSFISGTLPECPMERRRKISLSDIGLAAVGSVLYVSAYPQIQPLMGSMLGIKAFVAAVLGGIGILSGAVLGGFILGIVESLTRAYLSSQLADAFVFSILIIVLLFKPTGILGKNVKEKV